MAGITQHMLSIRMFIHHIIFAASWSFSPRGNPTWNKSQLSRSVHLIFLLLVLNERKWWWWGVGSIKLIKNKCYFTCCCFLKMICCWSVSHQNIFTFFKASSLEPMCIHFQSVSQSVNQSISQSLSQPASQSPVLLQAICGPYFFFCPLCSDFRDIRLSSSCPILSCETMESDIDIANPSAIAEVNQRALNQTLEMVPSSMLLPLLIVNYIENYCTFFLKKVSQMTLNDNMVKNWEKDIKKNKS